METQSNELKNTTYELFISGLSVLSIVNLILYIIVPDPTVDMVVRIMDGILGLIFLGDFTYRLITARSKPEYFFRQMGWADLLASLPGQFKILRLFRIFRAGRLLRAYGGKRMIKNFVSNRGGSALLSMIFLMILILEFGGVAILLVESQSPDANIKNAFDVLWYIYVTVTTVGYGDRYPVTNAGRLIGVVILTIGVGLFGTLTAFLAHIFIRPGDDTSSAPLEAASTLDELKAQMSELKETLLAVNKSNLDLKTKIEDLELIVKANPGSASHGSASRG
jgi:voltage-gated potassium channel